MFSLEDKSKVKTIANGNDEMQNFSDLADASFDFWNNDEDDIYEDFYNKDI